MDTGCGILDTGYWILDTGYWTRDAGYWMRDTGCGILDTGCGGRVAGGVILDTRASTRFPTCGIRKFGTR